MRPKDLVNQLRRIASKIENSSRPSKELVSRELRSVLAAMNEPTKIVDNDGTIEYKLNGKLHREDGPAVEYTDGSKEWWVNGKRHRTDGPAMERSNGDKSWWLNGVRHRTDGPAEDYHNGDKFWWANGKRHRTDGPALEYADGEKVWFVDGVKITNGNREQYRHHYPELIDQFVAHWIDNK